MLGLRVIPCDPGTEIIEGDRKIEVQNGTAVQQGDRLYISHDDYADLKAHPKVISKC